MTTEDLARQVLAQAMAIAELRANLAHVMDVAEASAELLTRVEDLERAALPAPTPTVATWCWRNISERASEALWDELIRWTGWIRHRYPLARRIPECWHEHPEIVEELTALWLAWHSAYADPEAPRTAPAEWHDRWLPGFLYRLEHGPFALGCANGHRDRPAGGYAPAPTLPALDSS